MTIRCRWLVACLAVVAAGCSIRTLAVNTIAGALSESGSVFASDPDPELVRDALPFALKTFEALLESSPENSGLLLAACSGFTQYAYAFVAVDAERLEFSDYVESRRLLDRAVALYLRGRDYCLRAVDTVEPGLAARLVGTPDAAALDFGPESMELLYWTAASWGASISAGSHRPEIVADLPVVRALFDRALELDEDYSDGALHEAMIALEALPEAMGGSVERAEQHYRRALKLSGESAASAHLAWATSVLVPRQDAGAFRDTVREVLAVDPDLVPERRMVTLIAQQRSEFLLEHLEDLFLDVPPE